MKKAITATIIFLAFLLCSCTSGVRVKEISYGSSDYKHTAENMIVYNSKLYLLGVPTLKSDFNDEKIFECNGKKLKNVDASGSDYISGFYSPIIFEGKLFFAGYGKNKKISFRIFVFDGKKITNVDCGSSDYKSGFFSPIIFNSMLCFWGYSTTDENNLYILKNDKIEHVIKNNSTFKNLLKDMAFAVVSDSKVYFKGNWENAYGANEKIFSFDAKEIKNEYDHSIYYQLMEKNLKIEFNGKVYGPKIDGNTVILYNINDSSYIMKSGSDYKYGFNNPVIYDSKIFFEGSNGSENSIYYFDGNEIKNITSNSKKFKSGFEKPLVCKNILFFSGKTNDPNKDTKIFFIKNGVLNDVAETSADYDGSASELTAYNSEIYFSGRSKSVGFKLFKIVID